MRGEYQESGNRLSYLSLEQRVPSSHPMRKRVDEVLGNLHAIPDEIYPGKGRPSISPKYPIRTSLLQVMYSVRSEPQLMEHLDYKPGVSLVRRTERR